MHFIRVFHDQIKIYISHLNWYQTSFDIEIELIILTNKLILIDDIQHFQLLLTAK